MQSATTGHRSSPVSVVRFRVAVLRSPLSLLRSAFSVLRSTCVEPVLGILLAPRCLACDVPLDTPSAGPVCAACWQSVHPLTPPLCDACGDAVPREDRVGACICARCLNHAPLIVRSRAAGAYDGALRQIVHALKYEGRRTLAAPLARLMRVRGADVLAGADLVVPVPLHWRRRYTRGFNQAEDLARHLGLPVCCALRRVRYTRAQFGLTATERRRNLGRAFARRRRWWRTGDANARRLEGACVVLVDDVNTTGATLEACANALLEYGVREVRALTAARALSTRHGPHPQPRPRSSAPRRQRSSPGGLPGAGS
ncbi:MAG TPA: ComF family protein [Vicinamibacterales bacterium]